MDDPDDESYFIPGVYMMSTKEALEAGLISYDKSVAPPAGLSSETSHFDDLKSDKLADVEKLIERLTDCAEGLDSENRRDTCCAESMRDAAAMLRSLAAEKARVEEEHKVIALNLQELIVENEALRAERDQYASLYMDRCEKWSTLRAKLEKAREGLKTIVDGVPLVRAQPYRDDGKISKCDKCPHDRYIYEGCEDCCADYASALLEEINP